MNKKFLFGVVAVVVVAAVVSAALAMGGKPKHDTANTTQPANTNTQSSGNTSAETAQATNSVTIKDMAFAPANITVKAGTTVTWTNSDSDAHTVTESDGKTGPSSGTLENGKSYSFTYTSSGTYQYHCTIHPSMTGTVTVTD